MKKFKIAFALMEIFLMIGMLFAFSYFMNENFSILASVSAQAPPTIGQNENNNQQNWEAAFPEMNDEEISQLQEQFGGNLNNAVRFRDELQTQGFDSTEEFNSALDDSIEDGQISNQIVNVLQNLGSLVSQLTGIGGGNFMNALDEATGGGIYICPIDKNGAICQAYTANECDENCAEDCIRQDVSENPLPEDSECAIGTCYDSNEGVCASGDLGGGSPRRQCENNGGEWYAEGDSRATALCQKGCCSLGDQNLFLTSRQCEKQMEDLGGTDSEGFGFDSSINEELICLGGTAEIKEGACTFESAEKPEKNDCKFVSEDECSEMNGEFHEETLCSNEELNTICEKQDSTSCFDGKDEVYWIDSCGNRENVYDSDLEKSWNGGIVLPKDKSCLLSDGKNSVANQGNCGNCNRLLSSFCGAKIEETENMPAQEIEGQDFVCRDMGCYEKNIFGEFERTREHDESWCAYQSSIGLPGNDNMNPAAILSFLPKNPLDNLAGGGGIFSSIPGIGGSIHSTDAPGSTHFKQYCQNGEIKTEACDTFRNGVCVEQQTPRGLEANIVDPALLEQNATLYFEKLDEAIQNLGNVDFLDTYSSASCRPNRWAECFAYNPDVFESKIIGLAGSRAGDLLKAKLDITCGMDSDCFVKTIDLTDGGDDTFKFSYCAPRYPPGFELNEEAAENGQNYCSQASSTCTAVFVKEEKFAFGSIAGQVEWKCKANCECVDYQDGQEPEDAKPSQKFTSEMNSLCVSMGDCGNKANYLGVNGGGKGYKVCTGEEGKCNGAGLGNIGDVFGGIGGGGINDANPTIGEYIPAGGNFINELIGDSLGKFLDESGVNDIVSQFEGMIGQASGVPDPDLGADTSVGYKLAGISGATGIVASMPLIISASSLANAGAGTFSATILTSSAASPALAGFAGAAVGAAIGVAVTTFLIDVLGIGPGMNTVSVYGSIGISGVGGALVALDVLGVTASTGPVGWVMLGAVAVYITMAKLFGVGEVKEIDVIFECQKWIPPQGGSCDLCGKDELSDGSDEFPCNRYSCEATGQNCQFVEDSEGENGGMCIVKEELDSFAPKIVNVLEESLSEGMEYENFVANQKVGLKKTEGECVNQYERITFGVELDEPGRCRMSAAIPTRESFEGMSPTGNSLSVNQTISFRGVDLENLGLDGELNSEARNDVTLYLACEDYYGTSDSINSFEINLCVTPNDYQPPIFDNFNSDGIPLPYEAQEYDLSISLNEPAECRWSSSNENFEDMSSENQCGVIEDGLGGYSCNFADIPLTGERTDICVKCLDHPEWEGTDREEDRNVNTQCLDVTLLKSSSELSVELISVSDGEIYTTSAVPYEKEILVRTSGGAFDGKANCYLKIDGSESLFAQTGESEHKQILNQLEEGEHNIKVTCTDDVNLRKSLSAKFHVEVESTIPQISRVFSEDEELIIITTEKAECAYTSSAVDGRNAACSFDVDEAGEISGVNPFSVISGSDGRKHSTQLGEGIYHIKCKDEYGNENVGCAMIASAGVYS